MHSRWAFWLRNHTCIHETIHAYIHAIIHAIILQSRSLQVIHAHAIMQVIIAHYSYSNHCKSNRSKHMQMIASELEEPRQTIVQASHEHSHTHTHSIQICKRNCACTSANAQKHTHVFACVWFMRVGHAYRVRTYDEIHHFIQSCFASS